MTGTSRLLCWLLLALGMLCVCAAAHAQSAPESSSMDLEVEACVAQAPDLLLDARLAKQSLMNSSVGGDLPGPAWSIARTYLKQISGCGELIDQMIQAGQPVPPALGGVHDEYADLLFLLSVLNPQLPADLDGKHFPACRKVLDSGIIDRAWNFINASNPSTVKIGDVMPYFNATTDLIRCSVEAKKHGMPGASGSLLELVAAIESLEGVAETNNEAQLLNAAGPIEPGRPATIQIQILPPAGRRVSPPQSCSGTVYGEGPVKTISWECF